MSQTREILTFQFGNYANYVGAHWWNIQESSFDYQEATADSNPINHDVLYRAGISNKWTTYTPRLLLVELNGALKHLPVEGELYGNILLRDADGTCDKSLEKLKAELADTQPSQLELIEKPAIAPHKYQKDLNEASGVNENETDYNLAESVDSWVDYLYARYHPRTVNIVNAYKHDAAKQNFDTYTCGVQLWRSEQFEEDFCDKIRQYIEECDYMQGFQTLFDCDNGFSGLATKCIEHLNDEYRKANFVLPLFQPRNCLYENADLAMSDTIRVVNSALCFQQLIEHASLFAPLSTQDRVWRQLGAQRELNAIHYKADNLYQTSAILAAYLETMTLGYRLKNAPFDSSLGGLCHDMTNYGRRMAAAAFTLAFPMNTEEDLIDCLDKYEGKLYTQLTPNCQIGTDYVVQTLCVRGIPEQRLKRPREHAQAQRQSRMAAYRCERVSEMFQLYLQCSHHASIAHCTAIEKPMRTKLPFPNELFDERISSNGFLNAMAANMRTKNEQVSSVPTLAALQSSGDLAETIDTLHREANRVKINKLYRYKATGLEAGDYEEALEALLSFKDNYEDNYEI